MNALRFAAATAALTMLCGAAGAETMTTTETDPLAVPIAAHKPAGERAALPWTAERQAAALPMSVPQADPAAVAAASERLRPGAGRGPEGASAAVVLVADDAAPIGSAMSPGGEKAADYWTPERMRAARPMPMPVLPEGALPNPVRPGGKNR